MEATKNARASPYMRGGKLERIPVAVDKEHCFLDRQSTLAATTLATDPINLNRRKGHVWEPIRSASLPSEMCIYMLSSSQIFTFYGHSCKNKGQKYAEPVNHNVPD